MTSALIPIQTQALDHAMPDFWQWVELVSKTVAASSARVYGQTYRAWADYAAVQGFNPIELDPSLVSDFLASKPTTSATRKRQLSAIRVLLRLLSEISPQHKLYAVVVDRMKAPAPEQTTIQHERSRRALSPAESDAMLRVWAGDSKPLARRNMAMVATLLLTGMRRAELAALQWRDVDLERGIIHIRHGKGDKARDAAILGDVAIDSLLAWRTTQGEAYTHVFTGVYKGGKLRADKPMSTDAIEDVINSTSILAGLDKVKPHDLRRTLITEMLTTGAPLQEAQAQAGHANGETTLRYAIASSAEQRRQTTRLRFGAVKVK